MERSYLVQRLRKPWGTSGNLDALLNGGTLEALGNAFAFGGGLRNGGLSDSAMSHLRNIFEFDYMGAAEFEFGAVPEALKRIAAAKLEAFTVVFPLSMVKAPYPSYTRVNGRRKEIKPAAVNSDALAEIFCIAPAAYRSAVSESVKEWACEDFQRGMKCSTHLNTALRPLEDYHKRVGGWLELDNGFFFFVDRDMFKATAELFGVKVGEPGSVERFAA